MENIGKLIRYFREELQLTRDELAEGICTPKYIYLIEKGNRTPSILILDQLFLKLNVQWSDYIEYIDQIDPIKIKRDIDQGMFYVLHQDYDALEDLIKPYDGTEEINYYPFKVQYHTAKALIMFFKYFETSKAKCYLEETFSEVNFDNFDDLSNLTSPHLRMLNLYAILLVETGQIEKGKALFLKLKSHLMSHHSVRRFKELYILISINLFKIIVEDDYQEAVINFGEELLEFMVTNDETTRLPYVLACLARAYVRLDETKKGFEYLDSATALARVHKNSFIIDYVNQIENELMKP